MSFKTFCRECESTSDVPSGRSPIHYSFIALFSVLQRTLQNGSGVLLGKTAGGEIRSMQVISTQFVICLHSLLLTGQKSYRGGLPVPSARSDAVQICIID